MPLKNSHRAYGLIAIVNHWVMAVAIIFLFSLGLYMGDLSYYDSDYRSSLALHKSLGFTLAALYIFRLFWRLTNVQPASLPGAKWEQVIAKLVHWVFYAILPLMFISGYLISTADGRGISVFGLFFVPSLGEFVERQEDLAGEVHEILAFTFISLVVLHALAALKHQIINRDNGLLRILKPEKNNGEHHE